MIKKSKSEKNKAKIITPKISVIIFSYNFERYLDECIQSILSQTLTPFEIIICDDHSSDSSWKIIQRYAQKNKKLIRAFRHDKNIGNVLNGAFARSKVKGTLQSEIDGDDKWLPEKLEVEWKMLQSNPSARVAYSNVIMCNESGSYVDKYIADGDPPPPTGDVFVNVFAKRFFARNRAIYRNELIYHDTYEEFKRDPNVGVYSDWDLKIRVTSKYPVVYSGVALVYYRNHKGGIHNLHRSALYKSAKNVVDKNIHLLDARSAQEKKYIMQNLDEFLKAEYTVSNKESLIQQDENLLVGKNNCQKTSDTKLIFLISQPRSGSTLLQRVLGGHKDIHTLAEPWIMLHPVYALNPNSMEAEYNSQLAYKGLEDFVAELPEGRKDYIAGIRKMAFHLYNKAIENTDKSIFLDKTPRYYNIIPELKEIFPEAKIILLFRNPLSVISSVLETWIQKNWDNLQLHRDDILRAPSLMVNSLNILAEKVIPLKYEEFVADPEKELRLLCSKLEIEYQSNMLNYGSNPAPKGRMGDSIGIHQYSKPEKNSLNKWKKTFQDPLYKLVAEIILTLNGPEVISAMGYNYTEIIDNLKQIQVLNIDYTEQDLVKMIASLYLTPESLSRVEHIIQPYLKEARSTKTENKVIGVKTNLNKPDHFENSADYKITRENSTTTQLDLSQYYQPIAGDTEKFIAVRPHKSAGTVNSAFQALKNYKVRDFGVGQDAILQVMGHVVINKFKQQWNGKSDFWLKTIVLPVQCQLKSVTDNSLFSEKKPALPEDIHPQFIESDERRHDVLKYAKQLKEGIDLGMPLYMTGQVLNELMVKPVAEKNGIYMLDGARRISAAALAHKDTVNILLIVHENEFKELLPAQKLTQLSNKMNSLSWFKNYQSISLIGLQGERSTNRFSLFDVNVLKDQTVMDFGCNIGQASLKALQAGAKKVIGVEGMPDTYNLANNIKDIVGFNNLEYLNVDFNDKNFDATIDRVFPEKTDYSFFFSVYRTRELTQRERLFQYIIDKTTKGIFFEGHADPKIDSLEYYSWLFDSFGLNHQFLGFSEGNLRPLFFIPLQNVSAKETKDTDFNTPSLNKNNEVISKPVSEQRYLVSAIVSTYNSEKFIEGKINDLLSQTIADRLEIIIIDSNSRQNEKEIVKKYSKNHKNIKYIRTENRENVYQAWNRGIKLASGKYVTNSNTDDRLRSDALEIMVRELEQNPNISLVYSNFFITNQENMTMERHIRSGYSIKPDFHPNIMLHGCHMGPQPVWRKDVHKHLGYFDESFQAAGDYEFWCRMVAAGYLFKHLQDFLGLYLHNQSGIINSNQNQAGKEAQIVRQKYNNVLPPATSNLPTGFYYDKPVDEKDYVNITVVTFNRLDFTKQALKSILAFTRYPYVLTVIDNNSSDGTQEYLKMLKENNIIGNLVLLEENIGVAKAANLGWALEADAEYYLKYDNDIVIQNENWLPELINVFKNIPEAGAVGYNFEPVSYPLQTINGLQVRVKENGNLGGACICIPKKTHKLLGFWSEEYGLYGEEDADYGFRIKKSGLLNIYMADENVGFHLPAGRAAAIDKNMTARDGLEESVHSEYRLFKDEQRRKNVLTGKYNENIAAYDSGKKSLYRESMFSKKEPEITDKQVTKSNKLKIAYISVDPNEYACPFIRLFSPLSLLESQNKIDFIKIDLADTKTIEVDLLRSLDIIVIQRNAAKAIPFKVLYDKVRRHNVKIIYEIDDAFDKVPKNHTEAFKLYSRISPEINAYIENADMVTVSTEKLKNYYKNNNKNIIVLPNYLNELLWNFKSVPRANSDKLRILFSGTKGHEKDLELIRNPLTKILNEYADKVELLLWGCSIPALEKLSNVSVISDFNSNYLQYAEKLQGLDIDFALVPLVNNDFNKAKSHIKWLEYSSCAIPAVFSKVGEYVSRIKNKKNGLIVNNSPKAWIDAIKWMITHPDERLKIALTAQQEVKANYTLLGNTQAWLNAYQSNLVDDKIKITSSVKITASIIIPVFNKLEYTKKCIESISKNTNDNYEVIVVDNGSTDGTEEYFADITKTGSHIRYIKNAENLGFAAANNIATLQAKSEYLVFLNNDTEVLPGWLDAMMEIARNDQKVGAVGCKLLYPDMTIQHGGVVIIDNKVQSDPLQAQNIFVGEKRESKDPNLLREYQAVTAACMLISKAKFEEVDGFDELFWNGYEDVDLCFKLREKGYKNIYQPKSEVIHHESKSGPERFAKAAENIQRLHQKWLGKVSVDFILNSDGTVTESPDVKIREYKPSYENEKEEPSNNKASIIMLTCNALEMTQKCVNSILKNTRYPYELIFVDNGSKDGTVKYIDQLAKDYKQVKVIKNKTNRGFSAANNQGVKKASAKYIMLLNNDVLVGKGWLEDMVSAFEKDEHIGMVGVLTNKASGLQVLQGLPYDSDDGFENFAAEWREKYKGQITPRRRLAGLAMLTSKEIYNKINGFDESYGLGNFEDDDISLKIRAAGYALMVHEGTFIHHYAHSSFNANKIDLLESLKENEKIFKKKWPDVDYDELLELKNPIHEIHPKMIDQAGEFLENYDFERAEDLYQEIINLNPLSGEALLGMALSLNMQNKFEDAENFLVRAYKHYPDNIIVVNQLGIASFQKQNYEQAETFFEQALRLDPQSLDVQRNYGRALIENGKYEQGVGIFNSIIQTNPDDTVALNYLAELYLEIDKYDQAFDLLSKSKQVDPANEDTNNLLEQVNEILNGQTETEKMEENSTMDNSLYHRAMELLNEFKASDAEALFRQSYNIEKNPDALFGVALCAVQKEQTIKAMGELNKLIEQYPDYAPAYNQMGMVYFKNEDIESAKGFFIKAIEKDRNLISAQRNYGLCLIETGDYENGIAAFNKILEKHPDDAETLLILAGFYCEIEKWAEAEKLANNVLLSDPQNENAINLISMIKENAPVA